MALIRAISTLGCPDLSLDEVGAVVTRHGLDGAELRCLAGRLDLPAVFRETYGRPEALAARVRDTRIPVLSFSTSFLLYGHTPADREELLAIIPWAEALGIRRLRVFDGGKAGTDAEFAGIAATLAWWKKIREANAWNVDLMVETHDLLFTREKITRFYTDSPGVDLLWDTHHTWRRGGEDPVVTWSAVGARVAHIHVKDSTAVPSERHPYTYVLPGTGDFPMAPLLARLAADRFAGPVSLEWEKRWIPSLPPLEDALASAAATRWW